MLLQKIRLAIAGDAFVERGLLTDDARFYRRRLGI
jgi:hypothetical protein